MILLIQELQEKYDLLDENLNFKRDENEKKVYFEFSDYSTNYIFFENPNQ